MRLLGRARLPKLFCRTPNNRPVQLKPNGLRKPICPTPTRGVSSCVRAHPLLNLPDDPLDRPDPSEPGIRLPSQAESIVGGVESSPGVTVLEKEKDKGADIDYLQVRFFYLCYTLCEPTRCPSRCTQQIVPVLLWSMPTAMTVVHAVVCGAVVVPKPDSSSAVSADIAVVSPQRDAQPDAAYMISLCVRSLPWFVLCQVAMRVPRHGALHAETAACACRSCWPSSKMAQRI